MIRRTLLAAAWAAALTVPAYAQAYDPASGESPLVLLDVPADGVEYHERRVRAFELAGAGSHAEAAALLEQLVRSYPRDPHNWMMLGHMNYRLGRYAEAAHAYQRAGPLIGWNLQFTNGYWAAQSHLAAGARDSAMALLRTMIFERHGHWRSSLIDWSGFRPLHDDPGFLALIGRPDPSGWSRDEGWRHDVQLLFDEMHRVNPTWRDRPLPPEITRRHRALIDSIPHLTDAQIYVRMALMLAPLRQGHVGLFETGPGMKQLPLSLWAFPEGVFVMESLTDEHDLAGARLVAVESTPAEEAMRLVNTTQSVDGDMQYVWAGPYLLANAQMLAGLGIASSVDSISVTLELPDGSARTLRLATIDARRAPKLRPPPDVEPPLFLRNVEESHWELPLPEHDALYVQLNQISADSNETMAQFGRRLWTVLEELEPTSVILDLRHNNGGTTQTYPELLRTLTAWRRDEGRELYALIGRNTFSATANLITDLERMTRAVFVGEASSECCNLHGDPTVVALPYSGVRAEVTATRWNLSTPGDARREMSPDVPVQLTAAAYFAGRDPVLEATLELIRRERANE